MFDATHEAVTEAPMHVPPSGRAYGVPLCVNLFIYFFKLKSTYEAMAHAWSKTRVLNAEKYK